MWCLLELDPHDIHLSADAVHQNCRLIGVDDGHADDHLASLFPVECALGAIAEADRL